MAESRVDRRLRFLRDGINANFTITCKQRTWRVDSGVLATESGYFEKLCTGLFSEASEGKASFPEEEPEVIDQILMWLYAGVYDDLAVISNVEEETTSSADVGDEKGEEEGGEASEEGSGDDEAADVATIASNITTTVSHSGSNTPVPAPSPWECAMEYPQSLSLNQL